MNVSESIALFERANKVIPGGVNSPVRAFKGVGGNPIFIRNGQGPYLFDVDGNKYIELINSWGPMILGHAHPLVEDAVREALSGSASYGAPTEKEVEMAELICDMVPSVEKVRMVNSGTEATMSAVRVARGFTGREKIIKMEGCYHGHGDSFLIAAGSGALTTGVPDSPGVTRGTAQDTIIAPFNNVNAVEKILDTHKGEIAALILEPVVGNMGCVLPLPGYLKSVRELCTHHGVILIFDEVMTGFRLAPGGAQELFGIYPDMTTLGKIIGGGLPVGAYGGKKEIMDFVSPQGPVYQAGTLSGNPLAMSAGLAVLKFLHQNPVVYEQLNETTANLTHGLEQACVEQGIPATINVIGSMFTLFFTGTHVTDFNTAKTSDTRRFGSWFHRMLNEGVYLAPSQFEAMFVSTGLTSDLVDRVLEAHRRSLRDYILTSRG